MYVLFVDISMMKLKDTQGGIEPGTKWADVPEDFQCPLCGVGKEDFKKQ
ncbi:hypothetical protein SDC9_90210 [bioreactor metagenome]|uniref:Rubredoxin domain-containing protein n=1 Tax=bioreactor metagenome TaxID=1076179 RepID=A0A644ZY19_9ZZZZ